ncbi:hypothetical protein KBY84_12730 [Cyanobium sp. N.Huapi 1H5]|uniref:hypothetical protein n=1 Tax=Cyanobium sp. N.Huapi 1H5 TaxID=2823719 RepID=UPI0020CDF695|nr:hypothetical protein [Cyanobium sp. N.Huapi 1H5]MCP9838359.1 hypothetical protein [Cyanobium sp. N.Huapi 1H5]
MNALSEHRLARLRGLSLAPDDAIRSGNLWRILGIGCYRHAELIAYLQLRCEVIEQPLHEGDFMGASGRGEAGAYRHGEVLAAFEADAAAGTLPRFFTEPAWLAAHEYDPAAAAAVR